MAKHLCSIFMFSSFSPSCFTGLPTPIPNDAMGQNKCINCRRHVCMIEDMNNWKDIVISSTISASTAYGVKVRAVKSDFLLPLLDRQPYSDPRVGSATQVALLFHRPNVLILCRRGSCTQRFHRRKITPPLSVCVSVTYTYEASWRTHFLGYSLSSF